MKWNDFRDAGQRLLGGERAPHLRIVVGNVELKGATLMLASMATIWSAIASSVVF